MNSFSTFGKTKSGTSRTEIIICFKDNSLSKGTLSLDNGDTPSPRLERKDQVKIHLTDDEGTIVETWDPNDWDLTKSVAAQLFSLEVAEAINRAKDRAIVRRTLPYLGLAGLCPVCGVQIRVENSTKDGRLIGSCNDAFTVEQWRAR